MPLYPPISTAVSATYIPMNVQRLTTGSALTYTFAYAFVITSGSATAGATYTNNGNTYIVFRTVSSATLIYLQGTADPTSSGTLTKNTGTGDATLTFSSFAKPLYLKVMAVGGGGGGSGGGTAAGSAPGNGADTLFGSSLLTAGAGTAGSYRSTGGGGTATVNSPAIAIVMMSGQDTAEWSDGPTPPHPMGGIRGGASVFGAAGRGAIYNVTAGSASANSGSGGGGGGNGNTAGASTGTPGASGAYLEAIIQSPSNTYTYTVGAGGTAGGAGTGGSAGGAGGSGVILIEEHYQ